MEIKPGTMYKFFDSGAESDEGQFKTEYIVMDEDFIKLEKMRAAANPRMYYEVLDLAPGTYVKLIDTKTNSLLMSDTPMELRTNSEFINKAHGQILIGGLGLGIVLLAIQDKPEVRGITVVEKHQKLVDFILARIPYNEKVVVYTRDIFEFIPHDEDVKYDTIYFDIWNDLSASNYPETKTLHKRFRKYLNRKENPNVWMDSWRRETFKDLYFG